MKKTGKVVIILVLAAVVAVVIATKQRGPVLPPVNPDGSDSPVATTTNPKTALPLLLDLGSKGCTPCKLMEPILADLKGTYEGKMEVVFIDVREDPMAKEIYDIQMIPTQIFFDASKKELYRHVGFFSKEDMLAKWKELGFSFENGQPGNTHGCGKPGRIFYH